MRFRSALSVGLCAALACTTVVDMGGPFDGGAATVQECAPCSEGAQCASGLTCALFRGDLYCVSPCGAGGGCTLASRSCQSTTVSDGGALSACLPSSGSCEISIPIVGPDGGVVSQCGTVVGPSVTAACHACSKSASDCQPNGCYGGYWCDTSVRDCKPAPKSCATP